MKMEIINKHKDILKLKPVEFICVNRSNQKRSNKIKYSYELNEELDLCLLELQIELQKMKYYMPPTDDMGSIVGRMS